MPSPEFIPLPELLARGRQASHPVAAGAWGLRGWEEFASEAWAWRETFAARNEERWALFTRDTWRFATTLFGAWAAGRHVVVPGEDSEGTLSALEREVDGFAGDLESPAGLPRIRKPLKGTTRPTPSWLRLPEEAELVTVFTSGSTGAPMGARKKLSQFATEVEALEMAFGAGIGASAIVSTVSHQHIYGLLFKVLWPLCAGRLIETRQLFYPHEILSASGHHPSSCLVSSPAHLKRLPDTTNRSDRKAPWRAVFSSGGPLDRTEAQNVERHLGAVPFDILGSSETGGIAWRQYAGDRGDWTPLPLVEIRIEEDGVLCVRSPQAGGNGWFATADRARLLDTGGFELLGRADRIVKIEEKRISLAALEQSLAESGWATEARVVILPGPRIELGAVIVPSERGLVAYEQHGKHGLQRSLREAAARRTERVGLPRRFRFVKELPVDSRGKVTQHSLEALFSEPQSTEPLVLSEAKVSEQEYLLKLRLPGHMPHSSECTHAPALPGIPQIDWALKLGRERFPISGEFHAAESLDFQDVLMPLEEPELRLTHRPEMGVLHFEFSSPGGAHASGTILFR
jgi:acyl-CoA synthetase (AMP-forming)/AMP-acid ligase II